MLTQGEFVYELYAVMIHSGGAYGGHYFAYIKNLDNEWWNFNDSQVTKIEESELLKTFGGEGGTNTAYMLMYRKMGACTEIGEPPQDLMLKLEKDRQKAIIE